MPPFLDDEEARNAADAHGSAAMALVVCPEGIVLHLRDEKDWIPHPGCWSFFGGAIEEGESPGQAIVRELAEEIGLESVACRQLWRMVDRDGDHRLLIIFEAKTATSVASLVIGEGQDLRAFTLEEALRDLKLAPFCRKALTRYMADS